MDRESRNFTDMEMNEEYVRDGLLNIHYAKEGKVYNKNTPDIDYLFRDMSAVQNKQFSRALSTKVNDAMRTKAREGCFPGNKPPLGYVHEKLKNEDGSDRKRGTRISPDPDNTNIQIVIREYQLRSQGLSYKEIRKKILNESLMTPRQSKGYSKSTVHRRLHNKFYRGKFDWQGIEYKGNYPLIIPEHLLESVDRMNGIRANRLNKKHNGYFNNGYMTCNECGCQVVADPKTKTLSDGTVKQYKYYRCSNSKGAHKIKVYISEDNIFEQFRKVTEDIVLTKGHAKKIADFMKKTERLAGDRIKREVESHRAQLQSIEGQTSTPHPWNRLFS